jgi:hypothetical protein
MIGMFLKIVLEGSLLKSNLIFITNTWTNNSQTISLLPSHKIHNHY